MKHKLKTVITITTAATITMHLINRFMYSVSTVKNKLTGTENHYYEWRFGKIRYTKKGTGTPLLLIHDLTVGSSQYEFHHLIDHLAETNEVYTIDLLGYGLSDKPNMTYTNYLYVQQLIDFIKNIIGKKTDVVITGDSAPIGIMACHNDPEVINKIILINPQSLYHSNQIPSKQTKLLKLLIDTPILGTFVFNMLTNQASINKTFNQEYIHNPANVSINDVSTYIESAHLPDCNSKFSFSSYIGRYMNTNIIHALKEINHSIYIIAGKEQTDIETIVENYLYYNVAIEATYIGNTKHLPHLEKPNEVLKQIHLFLS